MNSKHPLPDATREPARGKNATIAPLDSSGTDFTVKLLTQIETVRVKILAEFCAGFEQYSHFIERAVHRAEELAWQTDFPHLFFPELAAENAREMIMRLRQQEPLPERHSAFVASVAEKMNTLTNTATASG